MAPSGWAQWPWLQVLPLATGPTLALPSFFKLLRPTFPSPSLSPPPLRQLLSYLSPGNTWLRGFPERSFLRAYSLTWEERGTKRQKGDRNRRLSVFPPAQPARGGDGSPSGRCRARAALLGLGNARVVCLLRYPRPRSSPQRLPASTALRRPAPSGLVSPAATLSTEPCPRAQSPPLPHSRVCARLYTHTHIHKPNTHAHMHIYECRCAFGATWAQA